jgi:excisionase family DNA binding protein
MKQAEVLETEVRKAEALRPHDQLRPLTTKELAKRLSVSTRTIQNWRDAGRLPHIRITSRSFRYVWEQVERALVK